MRADQIASASLSSARSWSLRLDASRFIDPQEVRVRRTRHTDASSPCATYSGQSRPKAGHERRKHSRAVTMPSRISLPDQCPAARPTLPGGRDLWNTAPHPPSGTRLGESFPPTTPRGDDHQSASSARRSFASREVVGTLPDAFAAPLSQRRNPMRALGYCAYLTASLSRELVALSVLTAASATSHGPLRAAARQPPGRQRAAKQSPPARIGRSPPCADGPCASSRSPAPRRATNLGSDTSHPRHLAAGGYRAFVSRSMLGLPCRRGFADIRTAPQLGHVAPDA